MATLYITEFAATQIGGLQVVMQPPIAEQTVAIGAGSVQSNAFNDATDLVRLHTDAICSVEFGANPTSTAAKARMAAGQTEYFAVRPARQHKVAVITNT